MGECKTLQEQLEISEKKLMQTNGKYKVAEELLKLSKKECSKLTQQCATLQQQFELEKKEHKGKIIEKTDQLDAFKESKKNSVLQKLLNSNTGELCTMRQNSYHLDILQEQLISKKDETPQEKIDQRNDFIINSNTMDEPIPM